jgi:putative ABC transport system substrate-binding protein
MLKTLAALAVLPAAALAQQSGRVPVIGMLMTHAPVTDRTMESLRAGLRQFGYEDGRNLRLEVRTALGQLDRVPALAGELVQLPVDVIVVANEVALGASRKATSTIPIVMVGFTDDPLERGWIESYRRPGGNVTGIFNVNAALVAKRLELLKELLPRVSRVAVLWDPAFGKRQLQEAQRTGQVLRMQLVPVPVPAADAIETAMKTAKRNKAGAVMTVFSPVFYVHRERLAAAALAQGLPLVTDLDKIAEAGALLSYGSDQYYNFERAAYFVDRLLKGASAAELPVEQISRLKMIVNMSTAKALGITVPQPIMLRSDELIR